MSDDPLVTEFEKLERAIARRERAARQAACEHVHTYDVTSFGGARRSLCVDCAMEIDTQPPREP